MTEPTEQAKTVTETVPGVWTWQIHNSNIGGGISSSGAVADENGGCVLVDPVGLTDEAIAKLPPIHAVVLTARTHQRASWRFSDEDRAHVWMPRASTDVDHEPDHYYSDGDQLPGGLQAIHTPGPEEAHYCLLHAATGTLFVSDLVTRDNGGPVRLMPGAERLHDDADQTRVSIDALTHYSFDNLVLAHGAPVVGNAQRALESALEDAPASTTLHEDGTRRPLSVRS